MLLLNTTLTVASLLILQQIGLCVNASLRTKQTLLRQKRTQTSRQLHPVKGPLTLCMSSDYKQDLLTGTGQECTALSEKKETESTAVSPRNNDLHAVKQTFSHQQENTKT